MRIYGNLDLQGNELQNVCFGMESGFPAEPKPGRVLFREEDRTLYICASITEGLPIWVPCGRVRTMFSHVQSIAADTWTINHNMNLSPVMVQVYDNTGKWVIPESIVSSTPNQTVVRFATAFTGKAIILRGDFMGDDIAATEYEQPFVDATEVTVNHGLGYFPAINVYVDGFLVQPASIVQDNVNTATVTFNSPTSGLIIAS